MIDSASHPVEPTPPRGRPSRVWVVALVAVAAYLGSLLLAAYLGPTWFLADRTPAPAVTPLEEAQAVVFDGSAAFSAVPGRLTVTLTLASTAPPRLLADAAPVSGGRLPLSELSSRLPELSALTPASLVTMSYLTSPGTRASVLARLSEPPVLDVAAGTLTVHLSVLDAPGAGGAYTSGAKAELPSSSPDVTVTFFAAR